LVGACSDTKDTGYSMNRREFENEIQMNRNVKLNKKKENACQLKLEE
jgi:hypothetical protein